MGLIIFFLVIIIVGLLWIGYLFRSAVSAVIQIFKDNNALDASHSLNAHEIYIGGQKPVERLYKMPDYRPFAFQFLRSKNIIKQAGKNELYLSKEEFTSYYERTNLLMKLLLPGKQIS